MAAVASDGIVQGVPARATDKYEGSLTLARAMASDYCLCCASAARSGFRTGSAETPSSEKL
jgi:hypothetical protein